MDENRVYYTYAYLREDGSPYYIGKGTRDRAYVNHHNVNVPKDKSKILFLKKNLNEKEAYKHEIYMISVLGRLDLNTGILENKSTGGAFFCSDPRYKQDTNGKNNPMYGKYAEDHPAYGHKHTEETRRFISENQRGERNHMYGKYGKNHPSYGSKRTDEQRKKLSELKQKENNPLYGKICITNGKRNRYIHPDSLIPDGWRLGRAIENNSPNTGRICITNGINNRYVDPEMTIPEGWYKGRTLPQQNKNAVLSNH
jgi:hypothetical protein